MWDLGKDFFSQFQIQLDKAVKKTQPDSITPSSTAYSLFNYKTVDTSAQEAKDDVDIKKLYNIIQLTGDPKSSGYVNAQYFCNAFRPCSCCKEPGYAEWFTTPSYDMKGFCANLSNPVKTPS